MSMTGKCGKRLLCLPGDGIGPEVTRAAVQILGDCAAAFGHQFEFRELRLWRRRHRTCGSPLPAETLAGCRSADAVLLGAIGGPKWEALPLGTRPEAGLLGIRKEMGLYINLRPIRLRPALQRNFAAAARPPCGLRFRNRARTGGRHLFRQARNRLEKAAGACQRPGRLHRRGNRARGPLCFRARRRAQPPRDQRGQSQRAGHFRRSGGKPSLLIAREYPDCHARSLYVDNAAMQIMLRPKQFDVILTSNLFGDILSDEAAALAGSIGLIPSMSRGRADQPALYEPIHGSAPTLAGKDVACPLGAIFSATLMLRESFGLEIEAQWIEAAVDRVLERGYRTMDIAEPGGAFVRGSEFTEQIRGEMHDVLAHRERQAGA